MDHAARVAFINAQCVCAQAEIEGMKAHDRFSDTPYTEEAYNQVPNKYGLGHNTVISFLREG